MSLKFAYDRLFYEDKPCWFAELSSNITFFQNDFNDEPNSWFALKDYCEANNCYITRIGARNRDNFIWPFGKQPEATPGYFFVKSMLGDLQSGNQFKFYVFGRIEGHLIKTRSFKIPEMLLFEEDERSLDESENLCIFKGGESWQKQTVDKTEVGDPKEILSELLK